MVSDTARVECSLCEKFFQKIDFESHVCTYKISSSPSYREHPPEKQLKRRMTIAPQKRAEEGDSL